MAPDDPELLRDRPRLAERVQRMIGRALLLLPDPLIVRLAGRPAPVIDGQRLDAGVHLLLVDRARHLRYGLIEPTVAAGRRDSRHSTPQRARPPVWSCA